MAGWVVLLHSLAGMVSILLFAVLKSVHTSVASHAIRPPSLLLAPFITVAFSAFLSVKRTMLPGLDGVFPNDALKSLDEAGFLLCF